MLGRLDPAEILSPEALELGPYEARRVPTLRLAMQLPANAAAARREVAEKFGAASLDAFGSFSDAEALAAAQALDYVAATRGRDAAPLRPASAGAGGQLAMDAATRASLEILGSRGGARAVAFWPPSNAPFPPPARGFWQPGSPPR